jgi:predicted extracellular nuclease
MALLAAASALVGLPFLPRPAAAASSNVVISQVYGGGGNTGAPYNADFVELFNRGSAPVDLTGMSLQYASSTGTGNFGANAAALTELPAVSLAPGQRFLVQEAPGAVGAALPTPDVVDATPIAMSATAGKVALATGITSLGCNGGSTACPPAATSRIVDLVGFGGANYAEGSPTAAPSNTTSVRRLTGGCTETDSNSADFEVVAPTPRNAASAAEPCDGTPPPTTTTTTSTTSTTSTTVPGDACGALATHQIAEVQGAGLTSPLVGQVVRIEGVVTADFQAAGQVGGYYLQDPTPDADDATSDGVLVFGSAPVSVGDLVRASGTVTEFTRSGEVGSVTELGSVSAVATCGTAALPAPATVDLPAPADVAGVPYLERFEGVLVSVPETLTLSEVFSLARFGELTLSADGRLFNPTNGNHPTDSVDLNRRRSFVLDDTLSTQNPATIPFSTPSDTPRVGDTITGVSGVWTFDFGVYRVQPTVTPTLVHSNPRPAAPDPVGGDLKFASFNVLNYFTDLGCGDPCRGANNAEELQRQRAKEVSAINGLDADVLGLIEMQNNGRTALDDLLGALNTAAGQTRWAGIVGPDPGSDAIQVAFIYRPDRVVPVGNPVNDGNAIHNRHPLGQVFRPVGGGREVLAVINHFKSKGSCPSSASDPNAEHGQGCWNPLRVQQAQALLTWLDAQPTPAKLLLGDFNAYGEEDPIHTLEAAGYTDLVKRLAPEDRYSFVFDAQSGDLDHALTNADLTPAVTGQDVWHINADEPVLRDYNTEFNPPAYYQANAYRASDHDPVLVGVDTGGPTLTVTRTPASGWARQVVLDVTCGADAVDCPADRTLTTEGADQSVTFVAHDAAGNATSVTVGDLDVDRTAPAIAWTGNAGTYTVDQTIAITCTATDPLSGIVTASCPSVSGPAWQHIGTNTLNGSATDRAGNAATASTTYRVVVTIPGIIRLLLAQVQDRATRDFLQQKLEQGQLQAAQNHLAAKAGKTIPVTTAFILSVLISSLR